MENDKKQNTHFIKEIDVLGLIRQVLHEKKLLLGFVIVFLIAGIVYAFNTAKRYTSSVVLAPEMSGMGMSASLSDLAGMVGVELGRGNSSVDAIYPDIYPNIFNSSDFITDLFDIQVTPQKGGEPRSYYNHIKKDSHIPFWEYPKRMVLLWIASLKKKEGKPSNGVNKFCLTKEQDEICNIIRKKLNCQIDKVTSVITISVTDEDPLIAAVMADTLQQRLQNYISLYRTQKARNDLEYSKKIYKTAQQEYKTAQDNYAHYMDANNDVIWQSMKSKQDELENEMQIKYNAYATASQQLQSAEAKVQDNTPAFTILQQATVPLKASSMPRKFMLVIFLCLGICCDAVWVLAIRPLCKNRRK